jgi:hypothetical protein
MIDQRTWREFQEAGLLWWINRILHTFGWAIVFLVEDNGDISDVYPARVKFRGFCEKDEEAGFVALTKRIAADIPELLEEAKEGP